MAITNEHINIDEILSEYFALKDEVQELKTENDFLERQNAELKKKYDDFYINDYLVRIEECNQLWGELFDIKHMSLWEFAEKYCNDDQLEQAGHDFAKELLGGVKMSSHTLFEAEVISNDSELMDKKSTLRALTLKRDSMSVEIATKLDLTGYFGLEEIDFDDPRLADIKDEFFKIISKINSYSWEVDRLEALRDGELPRHEAKKKVYTFLNRLGNDQATDFLKGYHLSTVSLTEAVLIYPSLLDDLMNFEENLEIIRSNPEVWW